MLGKEVQTVIRKAEQIDNPDKTNVEKNLCLKVAHVITTKLSFSKESVEILLQGVFVKL